MNLLYSEPFFIETLMPMSIHTSCRLKPILLNQIGGTCSRELQPITKMKELVSFLEIEHIKFTSLHRSIKLGEGEKTKSE